MDITTLPRRYYHVQRFEDLDFCTRIKLSTSDARAKLYMSDLRPYWSNLYKAAIPAPFLPCSVVDFFPPPGTTDSNGGSLSRFVLCSSHDLATSACSPTPATALLKAYDSVNTSIPLAASKSAMLARVSADCSAWGYPAY